MPPPKGPKGPPPEPDGVLYPTSANFNNKSTTSSFSQKPVSNLPLSNVPPPSPSDAAARHATEAAQSADVRTAAQRSKRKSSTAAAAASGDASASSEAPKKKKTDPSAAVVVPSSSGGEWCSSCGGGLLEAMACSHRCGCQRATEAQLAESARLQRDNAAILHQERMNEGEMERRKSPGGDRPALLDIQAAKAQAATQLGHLVREEQQLLERHNYLNTYKETGCVRPRPVYHATVNMKEILEGGYCLLDDRARTLIEGGANNEKRLV